MEGNKNVVGHHSAVTRQDRERQNNHKSINPINGRWSKNA